MERITWILSFARCASAIARLSLGPLLPLLASDLGLDSPDAAASQKPILLSAYSSGYILTQFAGGYIADKYGSRVVIVVACTTSAIILILQTYLVNVTFWTRAYLCLGLVAGPLFPACSTAISSEVAPQRQAQAASLVDAAAALGTMLAALSPLVADRLGNWHVVLYMTSLALVAVVMTISGSDENKKTKGHEVSSSSIQSHVQHEFNGNGNSQKNNGMSHRYLTSNNGTRQNHDSNGNGNAATNGLGVNGNGNGSLGERKQEKKNDFQLNHLWSPKAICIYLCHSADNLTKYSINAWAATMLSETYSAPLATVGLVLALQEGIGVVSRLVLASSSAPILTKTRASLVGFTVQAVALWGAFGNVATTFWMAAFLFSFSTLCAGCHSIGYRVLYLQVPSVGAVSGFGNTVASTASAIGPILIGTLLQQDSLSSKTTGWSRVGWLMMGINIMGAVSGYMSGFFSAKVAPRKNEPQKAQYSAKKPFKTAV